MIPSILEPTNIGRAYEPSRSFYLKRKIIIKQMQYSYKIIYNLNRDAWNWWNACNTSFQRVDWKKKIDPKFAKKLTGETKKEAFKFLIPFLKTKSTFKAKKLIEKEFALKFNRSCQKIEKITGKPLCISHFKIYLTTFERAPYDEKKGIIYLPIYWKDPMAIFLHELCHF